ncbi:hypothetical protein P692DRAFT_20458087 [Suillus brevipes Sb2]|nr:hypothetical protein P692DRAFT_20458087 [Suillus brevipes Sb2]
MCNSCHSAPSCLLPSHISCDVSCIFTSHTLSHPSLAPFFSLLVPSSAISHHHSRALSCSFSHHIVILAPSLIASRIVSPYLAAFSILSCLLTLSCDAIAIIVLL